VPRVSVVIPAHDPGPWLAEALDSVRRQSFQDLEVVVVDDGSTQDLSWLSRDFPEVRLFRQDQAGASVARNRGILVSSGELIALMDQDDLWTPSKVAHQVDALDANPQAGLCFCELEVFRTSGEVHLEEVAPGRPHHTLVLDEPDGPGASRLAASLAFFGQAFVVPSSVMMRRDTLASTSLLDPWAPFTGDFDLLIRVGSRQPVVRIASRDVWYRQHASNFSLQYDQGRRELHQMRRRYLRYARAQGDHALRREARHALRRPRRLYAEQAFDRARQSWRARDRRSTAYHLARSAGFDPRVLGRAVVHARPGPR
jgi:glycosyltransferase involved in cell wall biosynthesis